MILGCLSGATLFFRGALFGAEGGAECGAGGCAGADAGGGAGADAGGGAGRGMKKLSMLRLPAGTDAGTGPSRRVASGPAAHAGSDAATGEDDEAASGGGACADEAAPVAVDVAEAAVWFAVVAASGGDVSGTSLRESAFGRLDLGSEACLCVAGALPEGSRPCCIAVTELRGGRL